VAVGDYAASLGNDPSLTSLSLAAVVGPPAVPAKPIVGSDSTISTAQKPTNGFLPKNSSLGFNDITDGLTNTIAIWESGGRPLIYRRGTLVNSDPAVARVNAGGWVRPASDILLTGSNATGTSWPGRFINRTNGFDIADQAYGTNGYTTTPNNFGTEGSSQPYSFHSSGLNVVLGDGSVRFIDENVDISIIAALVTRNQAANEVKINQSQF
jgi:hypothetical protein